MSISPVGNSDAYSRYRQQALDLLASSSQTQPQSTPTTAPSYVAPTSGSDQSSSNPYTTFKADLTALNQPSGGPSHAHGGHGHHHHGQSGATAASTNSTDPTDPTTGATSTDPIDQALDAFADVLKSATDTTTAGA